MLLGLPGGQLRGIAPGLVVECRQAPFPPCAVAVMRDLAVDVAAREWCGQCSDHGQRMREAQLPLVPVGARGIGMEYVLVDREVGGLRMPALAGREGFDQRIRIREVAELLRDAQPARPAGIRADAPVSELAAPPRGQVVLPRVGGS